MKRPFLYWTLNNYSITSISWYIIVNTRLPEVISVYVPFRRITKNARCNKRRKKSMLLYFVQHKTIKPRMPEAAVF